MTSFVLINFFVLFVGYNMKPTACNEDWSFALPFKETLQLTDPPMRGREVMILQNLLKRAPGIELVATGVFDENTEKALYLYQSMHGLVPANGILNPETAISMLENLMSDGYKDDGSIPEGMKFKLHIPVYKNRSIETEATLFDGEGNVIFRFLARTRATNGDRGQITNQLTTNGNTPTGLVTMDLNTPEPKDLVKKFGPYPVLRFVKGLKGNAAMGIDNQTDTFLSNYRIGILVHTGIWDDWTPEQPMPDSNGCVHVHPNVQREIVERLTALGVIANENPFGKLPYPYKIQGVVSVEQID